MPIEEVHPAYPVASVYDSSVEVRCQGTVEVGKKGKPETSSVSGCDGKFLKRAGKALRKWRWDPADAGTTAEVELVFTPPADAVPTADPLTWRRRFQGTCHAHVAITLEGVARLRSADEGCEPEIGDVAPPPERLVRRKAPEICVATFLTDSGAAGHVETFRCDLRIHRYVRGVLSGWTWTTSLGDKTPYSVIVQVDGVPSGAP